jgi:hypothetical protein
MAKLVAACVGLGALSLALPSELARPIEEIETATGQGVVFSSFREFLAGRCPIRRPADAIQSRGPAAATSTCAGPFTRLLQGVHTRVPGSRNADAKGV